MRHAESKHDGVGNVVWECVCVEHRDIPRCIIASFSASPPHLIFNTLVFMSLPLTTSIFRLLFLIMRPLFPSSLSRSNPHHVRFKMCYYAKSCWLQDSSQCIDGYADTMAMMGLVPKRRLPVLSVFCLFVVPFLFRPYVFLLLQYIILQLQPTTMPCLAWKEV